MNTAARLVLLLILSLAFVACSAIPAPAPPLPTVPPVSAAAEVHIPNLEKGQAAWHEAQCSACHGPLALGGIGPQLASTALAYDQFLQAVRMASPPKPAYPEAQLPDQAVYDIYAWVRTQIPPNQWAASGPTAVTGEPPAEEVMGMTIWACRGCDGCHGVFAQGGPDAPTLAGLNYPVEEELARMRSQAETIPEHSVSHISDETFARLYEWLRMGCVKDECYQ